MNNVIQEVGAKRVAHLSPRAQKLCLSSHTQVSLGMRDAMQILSGKWKLPIIAILLFKGKMRFMDLLREIDGIGAKMLSRELQELEINKLITRTVQETKPITVEYKITPYGQTLEKVVIEITDWGMQHRQKIMKE